MYIIIIYTSLHSFSFLISTVNTKTKVAYFKTHIGLSISFQGFVRKYKALFQSIFDNILLRKKFLDRLYQNINKKFYREKNLNNLNCDNPCCIHTLTWYELKLGFYVV